MNLFSERQPAVKMWPAARQKRKKTIKRVKKAVLIALPAAAVLLLGIFIGASFFSHQDADLSAAYYTVDINPSVCVSVDTNDLVVRVECLNNDALALMAKLDCIGLPAADAIEQIISAAQEAGYVDEDESYVLVGYFGSESLGVPSSLSSLQATLEERFGYMVNLLFVSGDFDDKLQADELNVSAGLLKLSQMADGVNVSEGDKVKDIIDEVTESNKENFCAPALSAAKTENGIKLSWSALDFDSMGYTGKITYRIVASDTESEVKSMIAGEITAYMFYTVDTPPQTYTVTASENGTDYGEGKYYAIYAEYSDGTIAVSNIIYKRMPEEILPEATKEPDATATPQPSETDDGFAVTGKVSGKKIILNWDKETAAGFSGYKVVASKTNPTPKYPGDGYIKYITNKDTTSISLYEGYGGLKAGVYYYFSITYLYDDGHTAAANAVRLKVPKKEEEPEPSEDPEPSSESYVSTTVDGNISGSTVSLNWNAVSHSEFEGYKVMYSFSDTTPVYGESGCYYKAWITNASTTNCSFDVTSLEGYTPGAACYFSISVLYDSHNVIKAGNVVSFVMPGEEEPEEPEQPCISTTISGNISDVTVSLNWDAVTHSKFAGYKVMYSFTDFSPVYGESGCYYKAYITDAATTSYSLDITTLTGYSPGATCYFSITVLYDDGTKKAGNTISFTAP